MGHSEIASFSASTCSCCRRSPSQREMDDRAARLVENSVRCPLCNRACPNPSAAQLTAFERQTRTDRHSERSGHVGQNGIEWRLKPLHRLTYTGSTSTFHKGRNPRPVRRPTVTLVA